jgi:GTP-binding protein Era
VLQLLQRQPVPSVLALNKIDVVHKNKLLPLIDRYARLHDFKAVVPISALSGDGVDRLERVIFDLLPEGDAIHGEEFLTDQTERTLAAEMIREKVLIHTRDELPYTTAVVIDQWQEPPGEGGLTRIFASILVDRESQRPIVVGSGGEMIKRIGSEARQDLEIMIGGRVFLDLHVKVRADWREDERLLDELGLRRGK